MSTPVTGTPSPIAPIVCPMMIPHLGCVLNLCKPCYVERRCPLCKIEPITPDKQKTAAIDENIYQPFCSECSVKHDISKYGIKVKPSECALCKDDPKPPCPSCVTKCAECCKINERNNRYAFLYYCKGGIDENGEPITPRAPRTSRGGPMWDLCDNCKPNEGVTSTEVIPYDYCRTCN